MNTTSKGFRKYDPVGDGSVNVKQWIADDSTYNMDLANTLFEAHETRMTSIETTADTKLKNKITLNGEANSQQNFNFIGQKVVQDGLEFEYKGVQNSGQIGLLKDNITFGCTIKSIQDVNTVQNVLGNWINGQYGLGIAISYGNIAVVGETGNILIRSLSYINSGTEYSIIVSIKNNIVLLYINGVFQGYKYYDIKFGDSKQIVIKQANGSWLQYKGDVYNPFYYNRALAPQEIQKNFSILNATQAINKFQIGDQSYAISTDTEHITDRTGRSSEEIKCEFYKQFCREFSTTGSTPITVNNGMKGHCLSGVIEGQTVKNYANGGATQKTVVKGGSYIINCKGLQQGNSYTLIANVSSLVGKATYNIYNEAITSAVQANSQTIPSTGIYKFDFVCVNQDSAYRVYFHDASSADMSVTIDWAIMVDTNNKNFVSSYIPFGLSSAQCILSNQQVKYSFYKDATDMASKTPISLGGLEGARNTLELKEDGSAVLTQNVKYADLNLSSYTQNKDADTWISFYTTNTLQSSNVSTLTNMMLSHGVSVMWNSIETVGVTAPTAWTNGSSSFGIALPKTIATNKAEAQAWINNNGVKLLIKSNPIVTTIAKELVPLILTDKINTLQAESAVAPYSMTLSLPTTDDIAKSYNNIVLLNGYTQTTGTATPVINLLTNGIVRLQMDLTTPATGINTTILTLPTELRPVTSARIPVFVNGVCQLATIDKTAGNLNLASTPAASANIYIKTDYRRDI